MLPLFDRTTFAVMLSAMMLAGLVIAPQTRAVFPLWVIAAGLQIGDTLFHELGHCITAWLCGQPAIPMIFTMFGADQAGGMTLYWDRSWFVQGAAFGAMAYGCYWCREAIPLLFPPAVAMSLGVALAAALGKQAMLVAYMGHGGAILMGGFFLFRAWVYLDARNRYERWLNALFGFFLVLHNLAFSYGLAYNSDARGDYSDHMAFGITHNDFMVIALMAPGWSVKGVGLFSIGVCLLTLLGSYVAAVLYADEESAMA